MPDVQIHLGDCLAVLRGMPDASVDSVVTDPPGALNFMGKSWDSDKGGRTQWVAWLSSVLAECLRVAKPGSILLCWAIPRTSHWTGTAIEDAGWQIEDRVSDFLGRSSLIGPFLESLSGEQRQQFERILSADSRLAHCFGSGFPKHKSKLKPAVEDWWLARKPGAKWLGVDACRVPTNGESLGGGAERQDLGTGGWDRPWRHDPEAQEAHAARVRENVAKAESLGRWPANLLLSHSPGCNGTCADDCPIRLMGEQGGTRTSGGYPPAGGKRTRIATYGEPTERGEPAFGRSAGSAARFFPNFDADPFLYCPKASRSERNRGCEGMTAKSTAERAGRNQCVNGVKLGGSGKPVNGTGKDSPSANHHPTVKPLALCEWLVRLSAPPGGVVLDPFMGSGSIGVGAIREGMSFIGIEQSPEYHRIASARIQAAQAEAPLFA